MALELSIHEITIAVKDVGDSASFFARAFNSEPDEVQHFPTQGIEVDMGGVWVGDFHMAMVSAPVGEGPVGRFLAARGGGIYEVNVKTNDLSAAVEHMSSQGIKFINADPIVLENYDAGRGVVLKELRMAFVDPRSTNGVLIEVAEWVE
ncbi:MAG: methylmalonyl-CoA/ethylmalonyl-CoA epimerase [Solirubrobacterales bacterium]|nr:methylmalonyl-CoA/ethylmalonyl-CoA epimerase [Solirubrobacterales bacterium]HWC08421.1 VOC family protein [Solirubrobacterales bacterium]